MRNALVLVLLCIGLTSGFIVFTSTIEAYERTESLWTSNPEGTTESSEITNISIKTDISHSSNEEEIGKEMLTQGSDDVKHVNERSFVLVNQRWKKTLYKSHLNEPNLNRNSLYKEVLRNSEKNKLRQKNYAAKKNSSSVIENKKYFPPNTQHNGNDIQFYGSYTTSKSIDNREVIQGKSYIYHTKEPIATTKSDKHITLTHKESEINVTSNPNVRSSGNIGSNREKYSQDYMELLNDIQTQNENNSQTQNDKGYEIYENDLLFKDRAHGDGEEENVDSFWPLKLSHLTLEEQAPQTQSFQKYNSSNINNFKYCQECTWKFNAQNYTNYLDLECMCKCGRHIHLRGPPRMRDFMNKRRSTC